MPRPASGAPRIDELPRAVKPQPQHTLQEPEPERISTQSEDIDDGWDGPLSPGSPARFEVPPRRAPFYRIAASFFLFFAVLWAAEQSVDTSCTTLNPES